MNKPSGDLIDIEETLRRGKEALEGYAEFTRKHDPASPVLAKVAEYLRGSQRKTESASAPKGKAKSNIRESLRKLCKECGWTPYQLHKQTGLDKKLVYGHYKGKGCSLQNRKIYADVFTKARKIPTNLES